MRIVAGRCVKGITGNRSLRYQVFNKPSQFTCAGAQPVYRGRALN